MIGLFAGIVVLAGMLLMAAGFFGIALAMTTPIQLQPLPLIALIVGFIIAAIGTLLGTST